MSSRAAEATDWRDVMPASRRCRACEHRWPHGAVLVNADSEGKEVPGSAEWVPTFCDACDDPCPDGAPMTETTAQAELRGKFRGIVQAYGDDRAAHDPATDEDAAVDALMEVVAPDCAQIEFERDYFEDALRRFTEAAPSVSIADVRHVARNTLSEGKRARGEGGSSVTETTAQAELRERLEKVIDDVIGPISWSPANPGRFSEMVDALMELVEEPEMEPWFAGAIDLFLEYRDKHGHDESFARMAAITETIEGWEARGDD